MSERIRRMNVQNGQPQQPMSEKEKDLPRSVRTIFMAGGQPWAVDEDIYTFCKLKNAFLADEAQQDLFLLADHRPVAFSRELMRLYAFAKTREVGVEIVDEPAAVHHINRR